MNFESTIWLFNVGRGLSILIITPFKHGILIDLGSSEEFSPIDFIRNSLLPKMEKYNNFDLGQIIISHPHADHISDIQNLDKLTFNLITCPHDKSEEEHFDFSKLEMHDNLKRYIEIIKPRNLPLQTIQYTSRYSAPTQSEYGIYYIKPPIIWNKIYSDNNYKYINGASILLYFRYGSNSILVPGDILPEAFEYILAENEGTEKRFSILSYTSPSNTWHTETSNQPSLSTLLRKYGLSVLVAQHHGLESGYCSKLYEIIKDNKPTIVMISDKRHLSESDGNVDSRYQSKDGAKGCDAIIDGQLIRENYSLTTRNGHHYLISFSPNGNMKIFGEKDPNKLLSKF
jgi:hypothetical protein